MSKFTENFKEQWAKSFGEHHAPVLEAASKLEAKDPWAFAEDGGSAQVWTALEENAPKPEYSSILKRIWNDAVRGGSYKEQELETPAVISAARGIGKTLGLVAAGGALLAGFGVPSLASLPILPLVWQAMSLTAIGGAVRGLFTKPELKKSEEKLVHVDRGAGIRDYDMITVPAKPTTIGDKVDHVMQHTINGWALPLQGMYRVINTPIRLTGYAAHAFGTAVSAAVETYKDNHAAPVAATPAPVEKNDFRM